MNHKGAVFHWVIFGLLLALGTFFFFFQIGIQVPVKGNWQLHFLNEVYFKAEEDLLRTEQILRWAGWEALSDVFQSSSMTQATTCSPVVPYPLWNKGEQWCLPPAKEVFIQKVTKLIHQDMPQYEFSELNLRGKTLVVKAKPAVLVSKDPYFARYSYDTSASVDIGYDFVEYGQITSEAQQLVQQCSSARDFESCVQQFLLTKSHWKSGACSGEESLLSAQPRAQSFCVESLSSVFGSSGQLVPLRYQFSLDFTSAQPFAVQKVAVHKLELTNYEITFPFEPSVEEFTLYFTNYNGLVGYQGSASDIIILSGAGNFLDKVSWKQEAVLPCASQKEAGKAYHCDTQMSYILTSPLLVDGEDYFFAVTSTSLGKESLIEQLVPG